MPDEMQVPGVEPAVAAEQPMETTETTETTQPSEERVEAAFAKRLSAEREKLEKEYTERYKDYDVYKGIGEYFRELNEYGDVSELNERIEMERLQQRAQAAEVSPEVQRRLEELEAKAAEADTLREQQQLQNWYKDFRTNLEKFAGEKQVEADAIERYMIDNNLPNMEVAYKVMKFEDVQAERERIEKAAIERYIESKKAPNAISSGSSAGHVPASAPKTWDQARAGALEMMRNANRNI